MRDGRPPKAEKEGGLPGSAKPVGVFLKEDINPYNNFPKEGKMMFGKLEDINDKAQEYPTLLE